MNNYIKLIPPKVLLWIYLACVLIGISTSAWLASEGDVFKFIALLATTIGSAIAAANLDFTKDEEADSIE